MQKKTNSKIFLQNVEQNLEPNKLLEIIFHQASYFHLRREIFISGVNFFLFVLLVSLIETYPTYTHLRI